MSLTETWFDVPNYEGYYQYSDKLRFRSLDHLAKSKDDGFKMMKGRVLKIVMPNTDKGYPSITLSKNGETEVIAVHKFFGIHLIPNPENKKYINHKNGNKIIYELWNLEWSTKGEDILHAYRTGLRTNPKGANHCRFGKPATKGSSKKVINNTTKEIYECAKIAAEKNRIPYTSLLRYLTGRRKNRTPLSYLIT